MKVLEEWKELPPPVARCCDLCGDLVSVAGSATLCGQEFVCPICAGSDMWRLLSELWFAIDGCCHDADAGRWSDDGQWLADISFAPGGFVMPLREYATGVCWGTVAYFPHGKELRDSCLTVAVNNGGGEWSTPTPESAGRTTDGVDGCINHLEESARQIIDALAMLRELVKV